MRTTAGRRARLAGLLGVLMLFGLLTAPPARAAGQLEEAIAALADGETVWVAEDYQGADPQLVELLRARYERTDTTFRIAFVTEEIGEDGAAAQQLAAEIGEPGVYMVHSETRSATSDSPDRSEQRTTVGISLDEWDLFDEEMARVGIGNGNVLLSLPDALDGDVSTGVHALADGDTRFFVDPAVTEAFPSLDEAMLESVFAGVPQLRVALVSGVSGRTEDTMAALAEDLPDDGAALLLQWQDDDFSAVMATGPGVPYTISDLVSVVGSSAITSVPVAEMPGRLALLASVLSDTDLLTEAAGVLGEQALYVHPGIPGFDAEAEYAAALSGAGTPVRVAFLPESVLELQLGEDTPWSGDDAEPAGMLAGQVDWADAPEQRMVVYRVDTYNGGRVSAVSVSGDDGLAQRAWGTQQSGEGFVAASLDALLELVDAPAAAVPGADEADEGADAETGEGGGWSPTTWVVLAVVALSVLSTANLLVRVLFPRRRRIRAAAARARKVARMTPEQLARERERAEIPARAARNDLERLDEVLAGLPMPRTSPRQVRVLQRIRADHERLLQAHADAVTWDDVAAIRERARRLNAAVELWRQMESRAPAAH
ncbi:hypothetical protein SXIM_36500 [Streptomyces xiamenensis]|uniref:DUF4350 domain-containing protein n=1 Tax=Streptomyces xiamenensis TaxID=408015 RepID=A0A0F7FY24_9ACTN|nr:MULTISPECIES: hypothetical protein [Streptomyces]AKG45034.1 hypothetical protein SXIM_36500 [Streptomyces xiamenensis]